jgi:O-antigen/teichoic acid export membrane protein
MTTAGAPAGAPPAAAAVARGGALNLAGALVYGACNFVLLVVLNRGLGIRDAGVVVVGIALFNIAATVTGLGCSTGLIRMISRDRATGHPERLQPTVAVAVVPVAVVSTAVALATWLALDPLTNRFSSDDAARLGDVVRGMLPFLPAAALHNVVVQATRGFDTMVPQVAIERIGRALALPVVVSLAAAADLGPRGVAACWAATNAVALAFSWVALQRRVRGAQAAGSPTAPVSRALAREYWAFTAPRAVGQASEVLINWMDTVIVGALLTTTAAGIYASGTRYLLPGLFAAEALMQVTGPRISGLLARHERAEASELVQTVAGWQVATLWPFFILVAAFPSPLLRVFGDEVVAARGALVALAVAMLLASLAGPAASTILMAGRSRQAMTNTLLLVAINLGGNLLFVPDHGIGAAGLVWGVTILVAAALPAWQSHHTVGVTTLGAPAATAAMAAAATLGTSAVIARLALGEDVGGHVAAGSVGGAAYVVALRSVRQTLHLHTLWAGIRRPASPNVQSERARESR